MFRFVLAFLLAALLCLFAAPADATTVHLWNGQEVSEPTLETVTLSAEEMEFGPGVRRLRGAARVARGENEELLADTITYYTETEVAEAEGNVVLRRGTSVVRAARARYDFTTETGMAESAQTIFQRTLIRAKTLEVTPGRYIARNATLTTCAKARPDYEIHARQLVVIPNERFSAREAGLDLFGVRLVTLPGLSRSLRPEQNEGRRSLIPRFGRSSRDGFYAEDEFLLSRTKAAELGLTIRLGTNRGPIGGLDFGTRGRLRFVAAARYRDVSPNQRARFLEVTRLPEIGVVWSPGTAARRGRFLPHQISQVTVERGKDSLNRWWPAVELSGGFFQQLRGEARRPEGDNREGSRLRFQAQMARRRLAIGPLHLENARVLLRHSVYDTGDQFSVAGFGIGKEWRLGNLRVGVDRFSHITAGATPFLFDDVELQEEWRPHTDLALGSWRLAWAGRIDASRGGLYNYQISIAKALDCLEPRLTWDARRRQILLQIRVLGLEPTPAPPGGTPVEEPGEGE